MDFATVDTQQKLSKEFAARNRLVETAGDLELWETPRGRYWVPAKDGADLAFEMAEQERGIYNANGRGAKPGDIVIDCGANLGLYTRTALDAGAKLVVAVDPAPQSIECLRKTFAAEIGAGRVILYPKGLWDKDDVLPMHIETKSAQNSFVLDGEGSHESTGLPLTTIDKMVAELKLERVDYFKFDIEGAEQKALAGGKETFARWHPRMAVCVYHLPEDPVAIPRILASAWPGYRHECGPCIIRRNQITPEVFFFY